jgi:hypothetical protein
LCPHKMEHQKAGIFVLIALYPSLRTMPGMQPVLLDIG